MGASENVGMASQNWKNWILSYKNISSEETEREYSSFLFHIRKSKQMWNKMRMNKKEYKIKKVKILILWGTIPFNMGAWSQE